MGRLRKPRPRGRPPKTKVRRSRRATTFFKRSLDEINLEIREAYVHITKNDKLWETYTKVTPSVAEEVYEKYDGRCVYCEKKLRYVGKVSKHSARLSWYIPLKVGGEARPSNLVLVCAHCKFNHRTARQIRDDISELDSFADTCEALFKAIQNKASDEIISLLKNRLNMKLTDAAATMRYVAKSDFKPESFELVVDEKNTIGEQIGKLASGEDTKKEITNTIKQVITAKQYKILRKDV